MAENYNIPVLFLIFNRPECTEETFKAISEIKPKKLYVAADGPRLEKKGEKELCERTREIVNKVNWECEIKTLFRSENLGCGKSVSGAITWFFENEEYGIILEDDCIPNISFFNFCKEGLEYYKDDLRIWHIDGSNFGEKFNFTSDISLYSNFPLIWGWASWRNRWQQYRYNIQNVNTETINGVINSTFSNKIISSYWKNRFHDFFNKNVDTWDYQWMITIWRNRGLVLRPVNNLVKNVGFGVAATHTTSSNQELVLKTKEIETEILFGNDNFIVDDLIENELFLNRFMRKSNLFKYLFFLYEKIKRYN